MVTILLIFFGLVILWVVVGFFISNPKPTSKDIAEARKHKEWYESLSDEEREDFDDRVRKGIP